MTDTTDDLAHLDARIDLIREQRDAMERIAAERAVASDRNLARWTSATNALHKATADLNATRERLTRAEAFEDNAVSEAERMERERDHARRDRNELAARYVTVETERDALRGEVDRLRSEVDRAKSDELNRRLTIADDERAEFVLAAVAVAQALDDGRSLGPAGEEQDPRAWVRFARGLAERVAARVEQAVGNGDNLEAAHEHLATLRAEVAELRARPVLTEDRLRDALDAHSHAGLARKLFSHLGPVTLPTPDRAAELAREIHRARLARLGQEANAIGIPAIDDIRTALAKLAPDPTPSKPADAFAGTSIEELREVYRVRWAKCPGGERASEEAGLAAILDALRVKLVAPVDPDAVLADVFGAPHWRSFANEYRTARCVAMRAALTANGIPVTPEAGK